MIPRKGLLRHGSLYIGTQEHMAREHKAKETQPCIYASLFPKAILPQLFLVTKRQRKIQTQITPLFSDVTNP